MTIISITTTISSRNSINISIIEDASHSEIGVLNAYAHTPTSAFAAHLFRRVLAQTAIGLSRHKHIRTQRAP